jgi:hypothetical protein
VTRTVVVVVLVHGSHSVEEGVGVVVWIAKVSGWRARHTETSHTVVVVAVQAETEAARPAMMTAERILIDLFCSKKIERLKVGRCGGLLETNVGELVKEWTDRSQMLILRLQLVE